MGSARAPRLRWARGGRGVAAQAVPQSPLMCMRSPAGVPRPAGSREMPGEGTKSRFVALRVRESFVCGCLCGFSKHRLRQTLRIIQVVEKCSYARWKQTQWIVPYRSIPGMWRLTEAAGGSQQQPAPCLSGCSGKRPPLSATFPSEK